jgi:hypothetical protein
MESTRMGHAETVNRYGASSVQHLVRGSWEHWLDPMDVAKTTF